MMHTRNDGKRYTGSCTFTATDEKGVYDLRGDRQDQQKKLSDEQLVLNAQSDKTAIGELIARYICTVE